MSRSETCTGKCCTNPDHQVGGPDEIDQLRAELEQTRRDYLFACQTTARMHAAAVGEVRGAKRGVVEDVEDLRLERDQLRADLAAAERTLKLASEDARRRIAPHYGPDPVIGGGR